jgi:primosomal protein N'
MEIYIGDAVRVPFGTKEKYGMVVGPGNDALATRPVLERFGTRTGENEIALAFEISCEHFVPFSTVAQRLAPKTRRGNPPLSMKDPVLRPGASADDLGLMSDFNPPRRILALAPSLDPVRVAALEAQRLSKNGQVLVLCPTKQLVEKVLEEFIEGVARMDVVPKENEVSPWRGFLEGSLKIAISTRTSALWPAYDLSGIIVLDENHPGHIESTQPHTNARDLASRRTSALGADLVLISSVPSGQALASRSKLISVGSKNDWPSVKVCSRSDLEPSLRMSPPVALAAVSSARSSKNQAFVVAPTGASKFRCKSCKQVYESAQKSCTRCGGLVSSSGFSPDRVKSLFTKATVLTIQELFSARPRPGSTVVIFDTDSLESAHDKFPSQTAASVLYAAARLAGVNGTVVLCLNDQPSNTAVDLLLRKDFRRHSKRVWAEAKALGLPPFTKMVECRFKRSTAPKPPKVEGRVLGPRRLEDGEWEIVILLQRSSLESLAPWVDRARKSGKARIVVS